jgi:hypothetical protein
VTTVTPTGGLKLSVHGSTAQDRRARFAELTVRPDDGDEVRLVTDASGRLRYRIPLGEYEIRLAHGGQARCRIRREGWTSVHLQLP